MKNRSIPAAARVKLVAISIAALAAFDLSANAQVFLDDNFTTGVQTGSLAPQTISLDGIATISTGPDASNNLVLPAWGSDGGGTGAVLNYNLSQLNSPLELTVDAIPSSDIVDGSTPWLAFSLGTTSQEDTFPLSQTLSVLYRPNGGYQILENGSDIADGTWGSATNGSTYYDLSVVLSNTAGTGSAFNGTGSEVSLYSGSTLVETKALTQLSTSDGYLTLEATGSNGNGYVAGLSIDGTGVAAPEPSTWALFLAGLGAVAYYRARRSKA